MAEAQANPSLGGYDEEFVNAVEDELLCAICQLTLKEPILTKCGHRFCRQCLDEHFKSLERDGQRFTCPSDRNFLMRNRDIFPDRATERKILSLLIKCPSEVCDWTGELRAKEDHLTSCPFKVVLCTNENCHVTMTRYNLQDHVTTTCEWRILECTHCNLSRPACQTQAHDLICKRKPLNCPMNCGAVIPREEIPTHTETDCPLAIISCPYAQMGCMIKVQRRDVESHLQSAMRLHLDLACMQLHNTEEELKKSQETTSKLDKKINTLENKLNLFEEKANMERSHQSHLQEELKRSRETTSQLDEKVNTLENKLKLFEEKVNKEQGHLEGKVNACQTKIRTRATALEDRVDRVEKILNDHFKNGSSLKTPTLPQWRQEPELIKEEQNELEVMTKGEIWPSYPSSKYREWRVNGINSILKPAIIPAKTVKIESPEFSIGGALQQYSCKLNLYINRGKIKRPTKQLSLYLALMKSLYYNSKRPFHKKVTFSLIDQKAYYNIVKCFTVDPPDAKKWVSCGTNSITVGGFSCFVEQRILGERGYIVNDTIFIRVDVDEPDP